MAKKVICSCDCCGLEQKEPTARICIQLYSREKGYGEYKTKDKWDVCRECGQKINDLIMSLRNENMEGDE